MGTFEDFLKMLQQLNGAAPVANPVPYTGVGPMIDEAPPGLKLPPTVLPVGGMNWGGVGVPEQQPEFGADGKAGGAFDPGVMSMATGGTAPVKNLTPSVNTNNYGRGFEGDAAGGAFHPTMFSGARPQPVDVGRLAGVQRPMQFGAGGGRGNFLHPALQGIFQNYDARPQTPRPRPMAPAPGGAFSPVAPRPSPKNGGLL